MFQKLSVRHSEENYTIVMGGTCSMLIKSLHKISVGKNQR